MEFMGSLGFERYFAFFYIWEIYNNSTFISLSYLAYD